MTASLDDEIRQIARRERVTDFFWAAGLSGGACVVFALITDTPAYQAFLIWFVIMAGLAMRYLTASANWSKPVRRMVNEQLMLFQRLRTVLNALPEPVILLQSEGKVELANPATREFTKTEPEGKYLTEIFRAPSVAMALENALNSGEPQIADFTLGGTVERFCRIFVTPLGAKTGVQLTDEPSEDRLLVFISDLSSERRLQRMRTDFIANASHELRTPLASMLGFIETLRGHAKDDPEAQERFLAIMQSNAERMLRLVRDLMSLSTIELNEHMTPGDKVDPVSIAEDVKASLAPVAEEYGGEISIETDLGPEHRMISGERDQLIQIIQNLTDNALKYAGANPAVTIRIGQGEPEAPGPDAIRTGDTAAQISARAGIKSDQLIYIQVRDTGRGIDRADLPRLTERFYRIDVEESRSRGGTGLGLAIVKHIVNRHNGGLQIESSHGHGSSFTCFFRPYG